MITKVKAPVITIRPKLVTQNNYIYSHYPVDTSDT